ncbi:MAG: helix-turn-helix domain-containing protein [Flavobacteriales bacterium]
MGTDKIVLVTMDELEQRISNAVESIVERIIQHQPGKADEYIDRNEAANILGISKPTLQKYTENGMIPGYRQGVVIRYKRQELMNCLPKIETRLFRHDVKIKKATTMPTTKKTAPSQKH